MGGFTTRSPAGFSGQFVGRQLAGRVAIPRLGFIFRMHARLVFVGRDPHPDAEELPIKIDLERSYRHGTFLDDIQRFCTELRSHAGVKLENQDVHVTDLVKCHWYRADNTLQGTQNRSQSSEDFRSYAEACTQTWLFKELAGLPNLMAIVTFSAQVYETITNTHMSQAILTAQDRSFPKWFGKGSRRHARSEYAEQDVAELGPYTVVLPDGRCVLVAPLRHAGGMRGLRTDDEKSTAKRARKQALSHIAHRLSEQ